MWFLLFIFSAFNSVNPSMVSHAKMNNSLAADTIKPRTKKTFSDPLPIVFVSQPPVKMKAGDNYAYLQSLIDDIAEGGHGTFVIPSGTFYLSKPLKIFNRAIWLIGSNNTRFNVEPGQSALIISGDRSIQGLTTIANIKFTSAPKGNATGIVCHDITNLFNVWVQGFSGNGYSFTADIATYKTNVSHSKIFSCYAVENGGHGFYFQGGDANAINVVGCDARDNGGVGFYDNSFLGNTFIGCMGHANKGGHYVAENGNNRSTFTGCYGEEDSPPSRFGGVSRVTGGLLGWEVTPDKKYYKGTQTAYRGTGGFIITSAYAKVNTQ